MASNNLLNSLYPKSDEENDLEFLNSLNEEPQQSMSLPQEEPELLSQPVSSPVEQSLPIPSEKPSVNNPEPISASSDKPKLEEDPMKDMGIPTEYSSEKLRDLQENARSGRVGNDLLKAASLLGAGMTGAGLETGTKAAKIFEGPTEQDYDLSNYMERVKNEKLDPSSAYTQGLKSFIKTNLGYDLPEGISGSDIQGTFLNQAVKVYDAKQATELKKHMAEQQAAAKSEQIKMQLDARKEIEKDKLEGRRFQAEQARLDREARSKEGTATRKTFMEAQNEAKDKRQAVQQFESVKKNLIQGGGVAGNQMRTGLIQAGKIMGTLGLDANADEHQIDKIPNEQLDKVSKTMVTEAAMELNKLLTGSGVPAQASLTKIVPNNILMDATKLQDYITNDLNPAQQAEFLKQVAHTSARIRNITKKQLFDMNKQYIAGTGHIRKHLPEDFDAAMEEMGFDPKMVAEYLHKPASQRMEASAGKTYETATQEAKQVAHPEDGPALKWAMKNSDSKDPDTRRKAMTILQTLKSQVQGH